MALAETLVDNFNDGTLNTSVWTATNNTGVTGSETGGEYQFALTSTAVAYSQLASAAVYDLTGSHYTLKLANAGIQASGLEAWFLVRQDANNELYMVITSGLLGIWKRVAGTATGVTFPAYSPTAHRWLRIRVQSGTAYWEASANGLAWTTLYSETVPIAVTATTLILQAGAFSAQGVPNTVAFDDVGGTTLPTNALRSRAGAVQVSAARQAAPACPPARTSLRPAVLGVSAVRQAAPTAPTATITLRGATPAATAISHATPAPPPGRLHTAASSVQAAAQPQAALNLPASSARAHAAPPSVEAHTNAAPAPPAGAIRLRAVVAAIEHANPAPAPGRVRLAASALSVSAHTDAAPSPPPLAISVHGLPPTVEALGAAVPASPAGRLRLRAAPCAVTTVRYGVVALPAASVRLHASAARVFTSDQPPPDLAHLGGTLVSAGYGGSLDNPRYGGSLT